MEHRNIYVHKKFKIALHDTEQNVHMLLSLLLFAIYSANSFKVIFRILVIYTSQQEPVKILSTMVFCRYGRVLRKNY